jgi:hypothetical protein
MTGRTPTQKSTPTAIRAATPTVLREGGHGRSPARVSASSSARVTNVNPAATGMSLMLNIA